MIKCVDLSLDQQSNNTLCTDSTLDTQGFDHHRFHCNSQLIDNDDINQVVRIKAKSNSNLTLNVTFNQLKP